MSTVRDRRSDGLPVKIDGQGYALDVNGFQRVPIAAERQLVDDGEEPGDRTINGQGSWKRTAWSYDHGAGQSWWDEDQDADRRQFRFSIGVDPWDRRELKLLKDTEQVSDLPVTRLLAGGDSVYAIHDDGATTHAHDPWSNWNEGSPAGARDFAWDGDFAYLAWATGIIRTDSLAELDLTWSAEVVDRLFISGGRMLALQNGNIIEIVLDDDGKGVGRDVDNRQTGRWFMGIVDMGGETYSWDHPVTLSTENQHVVDDPNFPVPDLNRRSVLYRHTVSDNDGTFQPGDPVLELPAGELIQSAVGFANVVVIGTNKGIRLAQPTSGGDLAYGGLIALDNPSGWDSQVVDLCTDGQYVWFTWTDFSDGKSGLGRLDLDEFIEAGVPAYATDIYLDIVYVAGETRVTSCCLVNGRLIIGGSFGAYVQSEDYVESGDLWGGWINFGSPERKAVLRLSLKGHPLPEGGEIRGSVMVDYGAGQEHGLVALLGEGRTTAHGAVGKPGEAPVGEEMEVHLRIVRGDDGSTPVLRRHTLEVLPLPFRAEEITLPIVLQETVRTGANPLSQNPTELLNKLYALYRDRRIVQVDIGTEQLMGYVDGVSVERDNSVTKINGWVKNESSLSGIYAVTVITTDIPVVQDRRVSDSETGG